VQRRWWAARPLTTDTVVGLLVAEAGEGRLGRRRWERRAGLGAYEQEQRATGRRLPTTHYLGRLFVSIQRPRVVTVPQSGPDLNPYAADL
jgi:hypothetical protein